MKVRVISDRHSHCRHRVALAATQGLADLGAMAGIKAAAMRRSQCGQTRQGDIPSLPITQLGREDHGCRRGGGSEKGGSKNPSIQCPSVGHCLLIPAIHQVSAPVTERSWSPRSCPCCPNLHPSNPSKHPPPFPFCQLPSLRPLRHCQGVITPRTMEAFHPMSPGTNRLCQWLPLCDAGHLTLLLRRWGPHWRLNKHKNKQVNK